MRILFTTHQFFPESRAGVEIVTLGLARELKSRGHEPFVLAAKRTVPHSDLLPGETEDYEFEGIPVRRIGRPEEGLTRPAAYVLREGLLRAWDLGPEGPIDCVVWSVLRTDQRA